jgi:hypothetical protein
MLFSLRRSLESRRQKLWAVVPPTSPVGRLLPLAPAKFDRARRRERC